jgi:hypothetical protein
LKVLPYLTFTANWFSDNSLFIGYFSKWSRIFCRISQIWQPKKNCLISTGCYIKQTTSYADVIADIQACKLANQRPHSEEQDQKTPSFNDNIDIGPSLSEVSCTSDLEPGVSESESSSSSSPSSTQSKDCKLNEVDPSNDHLFSGSSHNMYISEAGLMHRAWYVQDDEEGSNSSEEEDREQDYDDGVLSDGANSDEDDDLYNSD